MNRYHLNVESTDYAVFTDNEGTVIGGSYDMIMEHMLKLLNNNDERMSQLEQLCNNQRMKLDLIKKISIKVFHFPREKYYEWLGSLDMVLSHFIDQKSTDALENLNNECRRLVKVFNYE